MNDKQQFGSISYEGGCHIRIFNYKKILYINLIIRNKFFTHLVVSRLSDRGQSRAQRFEAE
ncbi:hypothetical protein GTNG_1947 [Geobacillus thermodenitrificans NG80-2]|uniref:Uncharacterized protein n=1 Tax=Geobacillus thermodenitrificans (strain NG80-2) TaxID=420246 RepID=A4IPP8_GEOTN|nr:hypothetical protein GTNG_1947 [Geobacillus thermodenitrificans NG80-2]